MVDAHGEPARSGRRRPAGRPLPILAAVVIVLAAIETALLVGLAEDASASMGIPPGVFGLLLIASLAGSAFDLPLLRLRPAETVRRMTVFGIPYEVPVAPSPGVLVAVNLGGAVIPTGIALYLLAHTGTASGAVLATLLVTVAVHAVARVTPGVGVRIPALFPPLVAAGAGLALGGSHAAAVAYVAGTLGTLIGADLLNLGALRRSGAAVASIGGAGTFDGIFLTGLGAAIIATLA